jgi:phage baseplate assembly protein gpV
MVGNEYQQAMKRYTVKKVYQHTETVVVMADSQIGAKDVATKTSGDRDCNDYLYDCEIADEDEIEDEH